MPEGKPGLNRSEFVTLVSGVLGGIMGMVIGLPAVGYLLSPALRATKSEAWVPVGKIADFEPGVPRLVTFTRSKINGWEKTVNSYGVYILARDGASPLVFSNLCTHLSCRVHWKEETQEYLCPCHDGHFNLDGAVTAGPPPRPLDQYETRIEGENLFIFLKEA